MPERVVELDELTGLVGQEIAISDLFRIDQLRIDRFAEATEDRLWIHIDEERAARESPYGKTIAHGFLTLSMISALVQQALRVKGVRFWINYGMDRVRFPAPVPAGSSIRTRVTLLAADKTPDGIQLKLNVTVECEGSEKPSCVIEWLIRCVT
jgi:acyl dehydratase